MKNINLKKKLVPSNLSYYNQHKLVFSNTNFLIN